MPSRAKARALAAMIIANGGGLDTLPDDTETDSRVASVGTLALCPFCGAPARLILDDEGVHPDMIMCGGDDCPLQPMLWVDDFDGHGAAAAAWNKRPTESRLTSALDEAFTVALENRCERETTWDRCCLSNARRLKVFARGVIAFGDTVSDALLRARQA